MLKRSGFLLLAWACSSAAMSPQPNLNLKLQFTCISLFPSGKGSEPTSMGGNKVIINSQYALGSGEALHSIVFSTSQNITLKEQVVSDEKCSKFKNEVEWNQFHDGYHTSIFCIPSDKFTPESSRNLVQRSIETENILVTMYLEKNQVFNGLFRGFFMIAYCQTEREQKGIFFGDRMIVSKGVQVIPPAISLVESQ